MCWGKRCSQLPQSLMMEMGWIPGRWNQGLPSNLGEPWKFALRVPTAGQRRANLMRLLPHTGESCPSPDHRVQPNPLSLALSPPHRSTDALWKNSGLCVQGQQGGRVETSSDLLPRLLSKSKVGQELANCGTWSFGVGTPKTLGLVKWVKNNNNSNNNNNNC